MIMKKLLVSYITLGYPNENDYLNFIKESDALGTDIFELGYPPTFAKYDGPLIRKSYLKVKSAHNDFAKLISYSRSVTSKKIIVLAYLESVKNNLNEFLDTIKAAGAEGVMFPDLLVDFPEDYHKYLNKVSEKGLDSVIFVSPFMPDKMVSYVSKFSAPFLYYGIRPTTGIAIPVNVGSLLKRLKNLAESEIVVGFGLKDLEEIKEVLRAGADGVAIGTAYVEAFEKSGLADALGVVKRVRAILDEF